MRKISSLASSRIALALLGVALALLGVALATASAHASVPTLYHSPGNNGVDPGATPVLQANGTRTLHMYLMPGPVNTTSGTICNGGAGGNGGNGDETCGVNFEIQVDGDLTILSFTPQVGQVSSRIEPGSKKLRVAMVTTSPPLQEGPTRLGTLLVSSSGPSGGTTMLTKLATVDANLDLQNGPPRGIAYLPEPGLAFQLAAGTTALALLARRRSLRKGGSR